MNSPRKAVSTSSSPRGAAKDSNSPREIEFDAAQLTPRRRRPVEAVKGAMPIVTILPAKGPIPERPKAAPRDNKSAGDITVTAGGRYGDKGGGDSLLRLPLEGLTKQDIRAELKHGNKPLIYGHGFDKDSADEQEEEEEEKMVNEKATTDKARFNVWKGKNYDLHVLGNFKSDFDKRVKSFQRPATEKISLDPFCRSECGLVDEPPRSDAFLIWKSKSKWEMVEEDKIKPFSSEEDEDFGDDDGDSLADPELTEYIKGQEEKRKRGEDLTGESIYYDEEYDIIRNLHRGSYSLTNYGVMPDDKWIGKANLFYPEMTEAEKKMLKAPEKKKPAASPSISPRIAVVRRK